MDELTKALGQDPQAKKLLENQAAVRRLLNDPEPRKVLQSLQKKNTQRLQAAAKAALNGDPSALQGVLGELARDPQAAKAMNQLDQTLGSAPGKH